MPTTIATPAEPAAVAPVGHPDFAAAAETFRALGQPQRLRILWLIARGELNVRTIEARTGLQQQAVTHHLTILKLRGMAAYDRRGKCNYYSITPEGRDALALARI